MVHWKPSKSGSTPVDTALSANSNDSARRRRRPHDVRRSTRHFGSKTFSGVGMNKTELIDHIAQQAEISKAAAGRALEAVIGGVKGTLKKGGSVTLVGFGTFAVGKRTARTGRNPRTGDAIKIKAAKVPKFRPGKALKDALN
ncbi:HU family DNA-binding protein [Burkholderia sp. WSM2230]|nr:HU family DNA-binding protein [Burkholderia sp. WSM2230]